MTDASAALRDLPSVDALLRGPGAYLLERYAAPFLAHQARVLIERWRSELLAGSLSPEALATLKANAGPHLERQVERAIAPSLVVVVNATGVVLHTNLGRAPWPRRVAARALEVASGYSNIEYDLETGTRGRREVHLRGAQRLFGAPAALVVNNNAAAVLLAVNTVAEGREAIVSRGELVEIGGSFRIPDVIAKSGAILREVGTTNRTRVADYERAIGERTGLLLKVHPSNYRVLGFTRSVAIDELSRLGRERQVPVLEDLGSGAAVDLEPLGVDGEPTAAASLAAGADLVTISGDKLLGGPQAGIILGSGEWIARLKANPLYRALRPDKVTIAALEELFAIYCAHDWRREVPAMAALAADPGELRARAEQMASRLMGHGLDARVVDAFSTVGGGAAPLSRLSSPAVAVTSRECSAADLLERLRRHRPPVIARIEDDQLLIDLRTVASAEEEIILHALIGAEARSPA